MPARATGSGTISFGMVAIPVKLYTASAGSEAIRFNQLHATCGQRVKQRLWCESCDQQVERSDVAKGYEFAKNQYVTFSEDELKVIAAQSSEAIEICEFVPLSKVDPVYFDKAYFLGPDRGTSKPYMLLREAMERTGLAALARHKTRGKDYLVLLRPTDEGIILQQLRHAYEVRTFDDVPFPDREQAPEAELALAIQLVEQISKSEFYPEAFTDSVREGTQALIQKKVDGKQITAVAQETPKAQVIDLMSALKASIESSKGSTKRKPAKKVEKKATASKTRKKRATKK